MTDPQAEPRTRLADAISGERIDWHRVEVDPRDIAALLAEAAQPKGLDVETLKRALQKARSDIKEWVEMEEIADSVQASEGADTDAAHDTDNASRWRRHAAATRVAAEYARLTETQP